MWFCRRPLATGADLPKEGTDSWTQSWVRMYVSEMKVADHALSEFEIAGSTRNDKGGPMWNDFSFRGGGSREGRRQSPRTCCELRLGRQGRRPNHG
jgi:hypothetical protein